MESIILFIVTFIFVYLIYFLFVINKPKSLNKWQNGKELRYLKGVYKIKIKDSNLKTIANGVALTNSFIVALTVMIVSFMNSFLLQMVWGFVILIVSIIVCYHFLGKYFQRKGMK